MAYGLCPLFQIKLQIKSKRFYFPVQNYKSTKFTDEFTIAEDMWTTKKTGGSVATPA